MADNRADSSPRSPETQSFGKSDAVHVGISWRRCCLLIITSPKMLLQGLSSLPSASVSTPLLFRLRNWETCAHSDALPGKRRASENPEVLKCNQNHSMGFPWQIFSYWQDIWSWLMVSLHINLSHRTMGHRFPSMACSWRSSQDRDRLRASVSGSHLAGAGDRRISHPVA